MKEILILALLILMYVMQEDYQEQLDNKETQIKHLVDYYENEDRKLLLEANELLRLRKEIK